MEGVTKQQYLSGEGHKQGIDEWHPHAVGTVYDMMHERSVPGETHAQTHVFLYSHAVAGDARAVEQATALLRTPDPDRWSRIAGRDVKSSVDQWTLHIRDEAQYLCQSATDSQKLSELDAQMPWIRVPSQQTPEIQPRCREAGCRRLAQLSSPRRCRRTRLAGGGASAGASPARCSTRCAAPIRSSAG